MRTVCWLAGVVALATSVSETRAEDSPGDSISVRPESKLEYELLRTARKRHERTTIWLFVKPQRGELTITARFRLWKDGKDLGRFPLRRLDQEKGRIPILKDDGRILFMTDCLAEEFVPESSIYLTVKDGQTGKRLPGVAVPLKDAVIWTRPGLPVACETPTATVLQEMHDLRAERTRLDVQKRYFKQRIKREPARRENSMTELQRIDERIAQIQDRLEAIERNELGEFERVAGNAVLECSEEPLYGQPSYGIILYATATGDIRQNELLLFHAGAVYRTKGSFPKLTTTGVGWYFRPDREIRSGNKFVVACIQDAPEEIENVKNGYMLFGDNYPSSSATIRIPFSFPSGWAVFFGA